MRKHKIQADDDAHQGISMIFPHNLTYCLPGGEEEPPLLPSTFSPNSLVSIVPGTSKKFCSTLYHHIKASFTSPSCQIL